MRNKWVFIGKDEVLRGTYGGTVHLAKTVSITECNINVIEGGDLLLVEDLKYDESKTCEECLARRSLWNAKKAGRGRS